MNIVILKVVGISGRVVVVVLRMMVIVMVIDVLGGRKQV